jgi:Group 4 capsule polysaccharide lipoprotein gfcB, YjbF
MTLLRTAAGLALLSLMMALAGCGSDPSAQDFTLQAKAIAALLNPGGAAGGQNLNNLDPAAAAALRSDLERKGQPTYLAINPSLRISGLMTPYGQNGDVQTWASPEGQTISLRQGLLVASRGYGPDLMSATVPGISQIAAGNGATQRRFYYLGGADEPREYDFDCSLADIGTETIAVLGKSYVTRRVDFTNSYWFDGGLNLRQSRQVITLGMQNLLLQRIID